MHVHSAGAAEIIVTPDLVQQRFPRVHPARVGGQEGQELELLVGQGDAPARHGHFVTLEVYG